MKARFARLNENVVEYIYAESPEVVGSRKRHPNCVFV